MRGMSLTASTVTASHRSRRRRRRQRLNPNPKPKPKPKPKPHWKAARFLMQTTFGPSMADIDTLAKTGMGNAARQQWIDA